MYRSHMTPSIVRAWITSDHSTPSNKTCCSIVARVSEASEREQCAGLQPSGADRLVERDRYSCAAHAAVGVRRIGMSCYRQLKRFEPTVQRLIIWLFDL